MGLVYNLVLTIRRRALCPCLLSPPAAARRPPAALVLVEGNTRPEADLHHSPGAGTPEAGIPGHSPPEVGSLEGSLALRTRRVDL